MSYQPCGNTLNYRITSDNDIVRGVGDCLKLQNLNGAAVWMAPQTFFSSQVLNFVRFEEPVRRGPSEHPLPHPDQPGGEGADPRGGAPETTGGTDEEVLREHRAQEGDATVAGLPSKEAS